MSNHQKVTKYPSSTNGYMMGCLWVLVEVYLIGHMLGTHDGCMMNININYVNVLARWALMAASIQTALPM